MQSDYLKEESSSEVTAIHGGIGVDEISMGPIQLTVVIPTYNERANVPVLLERLERALTGISWETVLVDDHSKDGTADYLRQIARTDRRVRLIERVGRRGLSSACIEGMMASAAPFIAVMDADLQHDETLLAAMLARIEAERLDVVLASRRIEGGSMGDFAKRRVVLSDMGSRISRLICRCEVSDAMSGFFMVEAEYFRALVPRLTGRGFKLLVDILASGREVPKVGEVPYCFGVRQAGESKLDMSVQLEYLFLIVDKLIGGWLPTRFVLYVLVGAMGVVVHLALLGVLYRAESARFVTAQLVATVVTMTFNFLINNVVTFRDRRLRGVELGLGLLKFYAACSVGALINVAFANMLKVRGIPWYVAGASGTAISSVWNYGVNTVLTWRRR